MSQLSAIRTQIRENTHGNETQNVRELIQQNTLSESNRKMVIEEASALVLRSRSQAKDKDLLDDFLVEFGLSNKEGIALMCLAEALLRIPDPATADMLIAEKISSGNWQKHIGQSSSVFVNASTWGLILTGKIVQVEDFQDEKVWLDSMVNRLGEPIVRKAMLHAMRILGSHYVLGRHIKEAMKRGKKENSENTLFSFDMLGEGARTKTDANNYFQQYKKAIIAIGEANKTEDVKNTNGISVKISALHPRYEPLHKERIAQELLPQILELAKLAKQYNIGFTIDAEEARRLDLSLDIFEYLAKNEELFHWDGLGFVLQAYQKRAVLVATWLIELARVTGKKLMVRLVKGAYWDSEIKYSQEHAHEDYPVFTRKANTDLSYQICAQILLSDQQHIYPQFATHNAYTVALIMNLAKGKSFEFQRLHGMGRLLYKQLEESTSKQRIRIYAPVGAHKDLLPYLVRRLLENGANSSFVNRFLDNETPVEAFINDVIDKVSESKNYRHSAIPLPENIYTYSDTPRMNSRGFDIDNWAYVQNLVQCIKKFGEHEYTGGPIISGRKISGETPVISPSDKTLVGYSRNTSDGDIENAIIAAKESQPGWNAADSEIRASILEKFADLLEEEYKELLALIVYEAGRTLKDGLNELREAVEFCRYYAQKARQDFGKPHSLVGPTGETNFLSLQGRGVFVCISPWNFPLAIFVGQIAAALAAGNSVIAKPAEQTPLVACKATELIMKAGVPPAVLQLVTGDRATGAKLVEDARVAGIAFTGSTQSAKHIQLSLAQRPGPILPLIAETGGQNAMIVDSSALLEQVTDDIIASSFYSAGQRCSSLRVLFVQHDIADELIQILAEACEELTFGNPRELNTDVGPVIDAIALNKLEAHVKQMREDATLIYQYPKERLPKQGFFFGPHIFELTSLNQLSEEVFGPVLHVIRWQADELDRVLADINNTGFGLTLGVHTRIENRARKIFESTNVGNTYVNRNMIGAVVGVNPFGGQGLSGTGPKAGGPHYLHRFATEKTLTTNTVATGGNAALLSIGSD